MRSDDLSLSENLMKHKGSGWEGFIRKFYQIFREELIPIFLKLFQLWREGYFHISSTRPPSP